jgi:hypothetical protein
VVLGRGQRGKRELTGRFPVMGSPAARAEGPVSMRSSWRTGRWLGSGLGWAVVAARRE